MNHNSVTGHMSLEERSLRHAPRLPGKNYRRFLLLVALCFITLAAVAANYYFHISAAGPAYAQTTFETDRQANFDGANRISRVYIQYRTPLALMMAVRDTVYVSYFDGKIAKFRVVDPTSMIRISFDSLVDSIPADSKVLSEIIGSGGGGGNIETGSATRDDYLTEVWWMILELISRRGVVSVHEYPGGPACTGYCSPWVHPQSEPIEVQ